MPAKAKAPRVKEETFLNSTMATARAYGWQVWHVATPMRAIAGGKIVPDSRAAGLADLILLHHDPPTLVVAELKAEDGKLSDKQREFLQALRAVSERSIDAGSIDSFVLASTLDAPDNLTVLNARPTIGVFVWFPRDQAQIDQVLRTRRVR